MSHRGHPKVRECRHKWVTVRLHESIPNAEGVSILECVHCHTQRAVPITYG